MNVNMDPTISGMTNAYEKSYTDYEKALSAYQTAAAAGNESEMFAQSEKIKKASRIMSLISEMATSIHNLMTKLIEKLNIRV